MFKKLKNIGPGAMVAAAFIGPGTVTTATIAGGSYAYTLLWAILFSLISLLILQEMAARLGVITQMGLGEAIYKKINNKVPKFLASFLVISAILVGNAAYEAGNITGAVWGLEAVFPMKNLIINPFIFLIAFIAFLLLFTGKYKIIERTLVLMVSIMGIVFFITAIALQPNLVEIFKGLFIPKVPQNSALMVIALIGTTVVPYNLFLHASAVKEKWRGKEYLSASRWDIVFSVLIGGLITMAILICSAVAFEGKTTPIQKASELAWQLKPILGNWSTWTIALGFLAAGLSSSITAPLAAAFATSEILDWKKDLKGIKFRLVWGAVLFTGVLFSSFNFKPTVIILFAQITNALLLPIIALFLLWTMNDKALMGEFRNKLWTNILGLIVIFITVLLALKGILSALDFL